MKKIFVILLFLILSTHLKSQSLYFPPLTGNTWDTLAPESLGWCSDSISNMLSYLGSKNTKAFIVLKDGKMVIEKYFGTFTQDSAWYWASAGKSLTAFLVGIAQQENDLSINDTSSKYLGTGWTNCSPQQEEKITIRHQLTMTSGMDDHVPDNYCTLDTCLNCIADPGTRWAYHTGVYTLLDQVLQNATGKTVNQFLTQNLKNATGMTGAFISSGYNNVYYSTPRSMARFGLLILNQGNWNGTQIMTDTAYFRQMTNTSQPLNKSYGYLWWLNGKASYMLPTLQAVFPGSINPHAPNDMIAALGKNGQIINIVPSQNLVYVRMGDAPGVGEVPAAFNDTIWQKLNGVMCSPATALQEASKPSVLKIFPNPSAGFTIVELPGEHYQVTVSDFKGSIVWRSPSCKDITKLDTESYPNGVYNIQVITDKNQIWNQKLIINR